MGVQVGVGGGAHGGLEAGETVDGGGARACEHAGRESEPCALRSWRSGACEASPREGRRPW
eukprot:1535343-Rhodomonas_salina.1